jgi:hypothetical protein
MFSNASGADDRMVLVSVIPFRFLLWTMSYGRSSLCASAWGIFVRVVIVCGLSVCDGRLALVRPPDG